MHHILHLDRSGWRYPGAGVLVHETGARLRVVPMDNQDRFLMSAVPNVVDQIVLHFPNTAEAQPTLEQHEGFWSQIDACAGADAEAAFSWAYGLVQVSLTRAGVRGRIDFSRHDPESWALNGVRISNLFGDRQILVQDAMDRVSHVAVPAVYEPREHRGFWSHKGVCAWDSHFTQHDRMTLLKDMEARGVCPGVPT